MEQKKKPENTVTITNFYKNIAKAIEKNVKKI